MTAFKTRSRYNLPARRRIIRHEGIEAPPELLRRGSGPFASPGGSRPPRSFLLRTMSGIVLILLAVGIFCGSKFLVERLFSGRSLGAAPSIPLEIAAVPEVPTVTIGNELTVARKIRRGDSLSTLADSVGIASDDSQDLQRALAERERDPEAKPVLIPGRYMKFFFSPSGELSRVVTEPEPGKELIFEREEEGEFSARIENLAQIPNERVAVGTIESSFAAAVSKAGIRYDLVDDLVDLFSDRVEFRKDLHVGDRFTVVYRDLMLADGRPAGGSQILAAALEVNGEHLIAARYVGTDGKARYFDGKGQMLGNAFLRYPLKFSRISSVFSTARFHPILKFARPHNGVDFAAPMGTPVRTVADGIVQFAGASGGSGNMIKIKHGDRYSTAYLHLSSIGKNVKRGAKVRRGDVIGAVGMTGLATGPHLHFSFYDNDKYVDPLKIKLPTFDSMDPGTKIDANYLKRVLFTLDHYQTVDLAPFYAD